MDKKIPFFSLERQWAKYKDRFKGALDQVLESQQFIGGKFVKNFEDKLAAYLNTEHVISCNSGTDALWLALKALKLEKDSIVLTTPFSFIASSSEIGALDAHPVFIDIENDTFNIDTEKLEAWLNNNAIKKDTLVHKVTGQKISGILAVNIFGQLADFKKLREIADQWGLWIVEDAAQSIGSHLDGKKSGTFGDIATFSFYPTKNMGALGDAGCVVTSDPDLASRLLMLRNHGRYQKYDYLDYGINSRMDAMQAAVLSEKLDIIDELNARRREIASIYQTELGITPVEKIGYHTYHQFGMLVENRNTLMQHLDANGIGSVIFYPLALNQIKYLQTDARLKTDCPVTKEVTQNVMSLPIWPELTDEEVKFICSVVNNFVVNVKQSQSAIAV